MSSTTDLLARLTLPGPKRLLALDGGGIRGIITLGYLEAIEKLLRDRYGRGDYRLADYFDLIGGTSTGALIGTLLALGWSVDEVRQVYLELAEDVFKPSRYWLGPIGRALHERFAVEPLEEILQRFLGNRPLDSPELRTGLMVVTKRIDTASVWPIVNLPASAYFDDRALPDGRLARGNRHFKLWEVLRASTAAPSYFRPEQMEDVRVLQPAAFVDGAISPHNNPALLLLMVATLDGFGLNWPLGPERMLLCSVGTGLYSKSASIDLVPRITNIDWAQLLVPQLVGDSMEFIETLMQWLSVSPTARVIDSTIGTVKPKLGSPSGLLHFLRYNIALRPEALAAIGVALRSEQLHSLQDMGNVDAIPHLLGVGSRVARFPEAAHFPAAFDVERP
jgi:uncharacterized protein